MAPDNRSLSEVFHARKSGNISDKWSHYLRMYDIFFSSMRGREISLLEIGVQNGGSLEVWADYFPGATRLIGLDVDPTCADLRFSRDNIAVQIGAAADRDVQSRISSQYDLFDIIIDDGSHKSDDIVAAFVGLFRQLKDGGVYVVEDLHTSYWAGHEGGLYHPFSSMSFFKRLADAINEKHWLCNVSVEGAFAGFEAKYGINISDLPIHHIQSITFTNSMCAIWKERPSENDLGSRIFSGKDRDVQEFQQFVPPQQLDNPWSAAGASPDNATERRHELDQINRD